MANTIEIKLQEALNENQRLVEENQRLLKALEAQTNREELPRVPPNAPSRSSQPSQPFQEPENWCIQKDCTNPAQVKGKLCIEHTTKRFCIVDVCENYARGKSGFCFRHGGGDCCIAQGCEEKVVPNTDYCSAHDTQGICRTAGCHQTARYGSDYCVKHASSTRCPHCRDWIDGRFGSKKYDGYCLTCFRHLFPSDPRVKGKGYRTKEMMVRNIINSHFEGFIHDKPLYTGNCDCTHRRRIDHRKAIGNTLLCIETDEFAHSRYDPRDEEIRYDDLFMVWGGKWIFIRFNPDGKGVAMEQKLDRLVEEIENQIGRIERGENKELVEIHKMYYI